MRGRFQRFRLQAMKEGHTMEKKAFAELVSSAQDMAVTSAAEKWPGRG